MAYKPTDGPTASSRSSLPGQVMVGKAYYHQMTKGDGADPDFACRSTLVRYVYEMDLLEFPNLANVQAILRVKSRLEEKQNENKPPPRYLY